MDTMPVAITKAKQNGAEVRGVATGDACLLGEHELLYSNLSGIVVVDGLLAIIGSTIISADSWGWDEVDDSSISVITDRLEIARLHNRRFSPKWAECSEIEDYIPMGLPF